MPSTYSSLKIQLMATGENNTTWGDVTNTNLGTAIEEAIVGSADVTFASGNVTLTLSDTNTTQVARNMRLRCTGTTGGATRNLVVPSIEKPYIVQNDCADSIVIKTAAGTGVTVPAGKTSWVYSNGTNVVDVVTHLTSLTLGSPLAVAQGGTGATTSTGTGSVVLSNGPTLTLTNATGLPIVAGTTGTLSVARGGTGDVSFTANRLLKGNGTAAFSTSIVSDDGATASVNGGLLVTGAQNFQGNTALSGYVASGSGVTTGPVAFEHGIGRTGDGTVYVDLHAQAGADFNARIFRDAGANGAMQILNTGTGDFVVSSEGAAPLVLRTSGTERMRVASGGDVGIGTNSPASKLHVNGTGDTRITMGNTLAAMQFGVDSGGGCFITNNVAQPISILTNNTERFRISATGGITSSNLADAVGYKGLPLNSQTASYTLALSDMGKMISITTGGVVIPANASVAFPNGSAIVIYNDSASTQTVSITTDTLRQSGTTNTGTRTLAAYGVATVTKVASTTWVISGNIS